MITLVKILIHFHTVRKHNKRETILVRSHNNVYGALCSKSQITPLYTPLGYAIDVPGGFTISKWVGGDEM